VSAVPPGPADYRIARIVAVVAGLLGAALAILTPFLPVTQTTANLDWPQRGTLSSVTAPLISYVPVDLRISVPCQVAVGLNTADRTVLLSTVPKQAPKATDRGLLIARVGDSLVVVSRDTPIAAAPMSEVLSPACQRLTVTADADTITGEFVGLATNHPPCRCPDGPDRHAGKRIIALVQSPHPQPQGCRPPCSCHPGSGALDLDHQTRPRQVDHPQRGSCVYPLAPPVFVAEPERPG
jgi:hypothetical protein